MTPEGNIRLRIIWSVFPLKKIIGGSICPSAVADIKTVRCFFSLDEEEQTTQSLIFLRNAFSGRQVKKYLYFIHITNK